MMRAILLIASLAACANASKADYDQRLKCVGIAQVFEVTAKASGRAPARWQEISTQFKAMLAQGVIVAGGKIGKSESEMNADLKTAIANAALPFRGASDQEAEQAFVGLGKEAMACATKYQQKKS